MLFKGLLACPTLVRLHSMNQDGIVDKSSTLLLDSAKIRRIREEMKLTQLYVSNVVGVTTDTVSRWENNRYPTIRRENALKLAEALEVSLAEILLKPDEERSALEGASKKRSPLVWVVTALLLLVVGAMSYSFLSKDPPPPATVTAERILPEYAGPGSVIPVQVSLTHRADNSGVILREYFPKGWKIVQANPPTSSLDNVNGVARWIIKAGDNRDRVVYLVEVDPLAKQPGESNFQGELVSSRQGSQSAVPVQGNSRLTVAPVHWADADGNKRIDDGEMLEASFTIEDMAGVHIDWNALEKIWSAGGYFWSTKEQAFLPQKPQP